MVLLQLDVACGNGMVSKIESARFSNIWAYDSGIFC